LSTLWVSKVVIFPEPAKILELFFKPSLLRGCYITSAAFGMGIDSTNVHQIVHLTPPDSIEFYIQETGRAIGDGKTSMLHYMLSKEG